MALSEFQNEPFTDFSNPENAAAMQLALAEVKAQFGRTYPLIIDGEKINTTTTIASINPADPSQVVGYAASASAEQAAQAIERANERFESWRKVPATERAAYLFKLADEMRRRKYELRSGAASAVPWAEARARLTAL